MMQFKCDCCGETCEISQTGPADSASCVEPNDPPAGWRAIYTVIEEHDEDGTRRSAGEVLYSCADCNVHMSVDEHHEAEFESRKSRMRDDPPPDLPI